MEKIVPKARPAVKFSLARKRLSQQFPYKESRTIEVPVARGLILLRT